MAQQPCRTPRTVIVTADDLGYAPERDVGIVEAFEHGCVTQASVRRSEQQARLTPQQHDRLTHRWQPTLLSAACDRSVG
jgi:hypothetical protein